MNEIAIANRGADWQRLKALVLDSVSSPITRRVYNLGLDEFIAWYGEAPRPGFTKATVNSWRTVLEGRALCRWGDPGFGTLVRRRKQQEHHFDEQLVEAAARLIGNRWRPDPAPTWVTCVPSRRHQMLVPDFARRLARRLGLPFVECIRKVRDTEPQKTRANSFQQTQNLLGAFTVDPANVRPEAVLLVDDMVDSRWTFTVAAALLLRAGSGPVFPFALADSSSEDND